MSVFIVLFGADILGLYESLEAAKKFIATERKGWNLYVREWEINSNIYKRTWSIYNDKWSDIYENEVNK